MMNRDMSSSGYDNMMNNNDQNDQEYNKYMPDNSEREYNTHDYHQGNHLNNFQQPTSSVQVSSPQQQQPPPEEVIEEEVDVVPPSPPPAPPSGLAVALTRLSDLTSQIEFQYAKYLQMTKKHYIIKAKIETLKDLPVGIDAIREDLDKLEEEEKAKS